MEEIKLRISIADSALEPWRGRKTISVPNCELALLQLRKCFELIAFASLAANRGQFERAWSRYSREWRLDRICKEIQKKNPHFLPVAVQEEPDPEPGVKANIVLKEAPKFSLKYLLKCHGRIGNLMHARNPFDAEIDYEAELIEATRMRDEILHLLNLHTVWVVKDHIFYRVAMQSELDGKVQVAVMQRTP